MRTVIVIWFVVLAAALVAIVADTPPAVKIFSALICLAFGALILYARRSRGSQL